MFNIAFFKFLHVYKVQKVNTDMQIGVKKIQAKIPMLKMILFLEKTIGIFIARIFHHL